MPGINHRKCCCGGAEPCAYCNTTPSQLEIVLAGITDVGGLCRMFDDGSGYYLDRPTLNGTFILSQISACTWSYGFTCSMKKRRFYASDDCTGPYTEDTTSFIRFGITVARNYDTWAVNAAVDFAYFFEGVVAAEIGECLEEAAVDNGLPALVPAPDYANDIKQAELLGTGGTATIRPYNPAP